jgi:hypothetical protein
MAFQTPNFNVWCRVWRGLTLSTYTLLGYSKCQVRGVDSHLDALLGNVPWQILFPRGTDIRDGDSTSTNVGDQVEVAGWDGTWFLVDSVTDKGCGFTNEYRIAIGRTIRAAGRTTPQQLNPVNKDLVPPVGYTPVPIRTPAPGWPTTVVP